MSATSLPQFTDIDLKHFVEQLDALLNANLQQISSLLSENNSFTWDNLMRPLEDMEDALERFWSPVAHLHAVVNSPDLRNCYQACLPKLSSYEATIGHNQCLYEAVKSLDRNKLDEAQVKIIEDTLRGFELAGVALSSEKKQRFEAIQTRLSELSNQFENNVLDAGQAYQLHITDAARLTGLPDHALHHARVLAEEKKLDGWVLNLEIPCYLAVVTYADDRTLREEIYRAYVTRASDQGPNAGQFDNTSIMNELLALRHEKAQLLEFANYAELSLATKMAKSCKQVTDFLLDLSHRAYQQAKGEFKQLQDFAKKNYALDEVQPWDIAYLSEKKRQQLHAISQEELRPFFPLPKVMEGLFAIVNKLYGMSVQEIKDIDTWHSDVICYEVRDSEHNTRGYLYVDLFARTHKRGGAWMDSCQSRRKLVDGSIQRPIATLTCNFAKPAANQVASLSHDEVLTLFHELGHCLHHILTQVDYLSASGIHGVEWDAVELPSQFFENWCWEEQALQWLTSHRDTGEPLPKDMFAKLLAAKNFQSAMMMMRQLEFSLFDFRIHQEYASNQPEFIASILADVRRNVSVVPIVSYNRFQHGFTHIFSGGYAAGYYSYKWAEVLSSDAFARFEEEGIFNEDTGRDFLRCILEVGGARNAEDAYQSFRGRPATVDALLRHNGIE
ncbi:M3 family metallopeptidase [Legionella nagasakiensis]|uniref:M3 family metallopeptidase n=1 Tax=Legionella nagasakiensis TaxID=535290 RepID=UPI0010559DE7|nr:M3 family metallopeptidase [Legionella nagasakiensis]